MVTAMAYVSLMSVCFLVPFNFSCFTSSSHGVLKQVAAHWSEVPEIFRLAVKARKSLSSYEHHLNFKKIDNKGRSKERSSSSSLNSNDYGSDTNFHTKLASSPKRTFMPCELLCTLVIHAVNWMPSYYADVRWPRCNFNALISCYFSFYWVVWWGGFSS